MKQNNPLKTILLDMDGVLWHGSKPVLEIRLLFDRIQELDLQAFCVTNNSTRSVSYHLDKLKGFGVSLDPSQILTSAEATADFLEGKFRKRGSLFVIGERGVRDALEKSGFQILEDGSAKDVIAVVIGLDQDLTYRDLNLAVHYIRQGAYFVGTNPDLTIPTPTGAAPGAGAIIRGVELSSGKRAHVIGKPHSALYSLALARAKSLPEETLMIGDRLETDIFGAQQMGIRTAVVLTGIATKEQAATWDPKPDIIAANAHQVLDEIRNNDE